MADIKKLFYPHEGRGRELNDLLRRELGIPDSAKWFEVRFAISEPLAVKCEFLPREKVDGNG